ncbi:MAG TPA: membrane-associated protein [Gammaproteobacteria bacterium]|nr:membrane-associated protein [Gammaproteobacteria bacterium]
MKRVSRRSLLLAVAVGGLTAWSVAGGENLEPRAVETVTIAFRVLFTALVVVIVPVYFVKYGPANFLWFSDVGLLGIAAAFWLESPLLGSMMALCVLLPETLWLVSFLTGVLTRGRAATTLAAYMFDSKIPLYLRALSCAFHAALPPGALWLVYRYGYESQALGAQWLLAWIVLPATFWLAPREKNINWVHGFGHPPRSPFGPATHFALMMLAYPTLVYLPAHWLLLRLVPG